MRQRWKAVLAGLLVLGVHCRPSEPSLRERLVRSPVLVEALVLTQLEIHEGPSPPRIEGRYWMKGEVLRSSIGTQGRRVDTSVCLLASALRGTVFEDRVLSRVRSAVLSGSGSDFTLLQELSSSSGADLLVLTGTQIREEVLLADSLRVERGPKGELQYEQAKLILRRVGDCRSR